MKRRSLVAVLHLLFFVSAAAHDRSNFGQVVVFGDSLSDKGNMYQLTGQTDPTTSSPYV